MDPEQIPGCLRERAQWVCWAEQTRNGKSTKVPKDPTGGGNASSSDMATWADFETAVSTAEARGWGVGFVFAEAGPYAGIDIDGGLVDPERPEEWLRELGLDPFVDETYIEVSPSAEGLHILIIGERPEWWQNVSRDIADGHDQGVEVYDSGRFFTVTGDVTDVSADTVAEVDHEPWLREAWRAFRDDPPGGASESAQTAADGDVDLPLSAVLPPGYSGGERHEHPVHGSETGSNFLVDENDETWRCWRHQCTGNALHLVGMKHGIIECGEWDGDGLPSETWADIFDAAREEGHDVGEPPETAATDGGATAETPSSSPPAAASDDAESDGWEQVFSMYASADNADERLPARFQATETLSDQHHWRNMLQSDQLWSFDADSGLFRPDGESRVRELLVSHLGHHYRGHEHREICEQLRGRFTVEEEDMGGPDNAILTENSVIEIDTDGIDTREPSPQDNFIGRVQTPFDPDAECPRWREFLNESLTTGADRKKVQEYAGYCLHHWGLPHHKALFLVGPTASGKSTFLDTIRAMLGDDATANLTPQQMTSERFGTAELFGAWANIRNDIPASVIEDTGQFKEITAGDPLKAEEKHQDPFMFEPRAKHMFSANQLPDADTDDEAFFRRVLLVPFPDTVPRSERDPELDDKLQAELPGILNWALEGLQRLLQQAEFTADRDPGATQQTWQKWGHSVDRFYKMCLEDDDSNAIPKKSVYSAYLAFCDEEGVPKDTQHAMTRALKANGVEDGRQYVDGNQQRCFIGIDWTSRGAGLVDESAADSKPTGMGDY